jgi:multimeric flavodoxin WrbA
MGSPRKNGASARMLDITLNEISTTHPEIETERVDIVDLKISACTGCDACLKTDCPLDQDDDYPSLVAKLVDASAIIVASPVYFANVPGIVKNVIDRSRRMKMNRNQLKNKWFGTLVASGLRNGGTETVTMLLNMWALSQGMLPIQGLGNQVIENPFGMTTLQKDGLKEFRKPIDADEIGDKAAKRLGERVVELVKLVPGNA